MHRLILLSILVSFKKSLLFVLAVMEKHTHSHVAYKEGSTGSLSLNSFTNQISFCLCLGKDGFAVILTSATVSFESRTRGKKEGPMKFKETDRDESNKKRSRDSKEREKSNVQVESDVSYAFQNDDQSSRPAPTRPI